AGPRGDPLRGEEAGRHPADLPRVQTRGRLKPARLNSQANRTTSADFTAAPIRNGAKPAATAAPSPLRVASKPAPASRISRWTPQRTANPATGRRSRPATAAQPTRAAPGGKANR